MNKRFKNIVSNFKEDPKNNKEILINELKKVKIKSRFSYKKIIYYLFKSEKKYFEKNPDVVCYIFSDKELINTYVLEYFYRKKNIHLLFENNDGFYQLIKNSNFNFLSRFLHFLWNYAYSESSNDDIVFIFSTMIKKASTVKIAQVFLKIIAKNKDQEKLKELLYNKYFIKKDFLKLGEIFFYRYEKYQLLLSESYVLRRLENGKIIKNAEFVDKLFKTKNAIIIEAASKKITKISWEKDKLLDFMKKNNIKLDKKISKILL